MSFFFLNSKQKLIVTFLILFGLAHTIKHEDVSINYVQQFQSEDKLKPNAIIINTKLKYRLNPYKRFVFGQGLSEEELLWLVSEIRSWLASIDEQK